MPMPLRWFNNNATQWRLAKTTAAHRTTDGALAVHSPGPTANQVSAAVLVPDRHPPHHRHHHRGARHGDDEEQAGQLVQHAVAVRAEHRATRSSARRWRRWRPRRRWPAARLAAARLASTRRPVSPPGPPGLGAEIRTDRVRRQRHPRGHPFYQEFCRSRLGFDAFSHERQPRSDRSTDNGLPLRSDKPRSRASSGRRLSRVQGPRSAQDAASSPDRRVVTTRKRVRSTARGANSSIWGVRKGITLAPNAVEAACTHPWASPRSPRLSPRCRCR